MSMPGRDCITTAGGLAAIHVTRIKAAALADKGGKASEGDADSGAPRRTDFENRKIGYGVHYGVQWAKENALSSLRPLKAFG
jgi:hypothetical protein